jgi:crotonobetainyl-CoA:carnitine CoA-transferase CaiB-like acyl-CoA transferase
VTVPAAEGPLAGLRVLDLSTVIAGPMAAMLLGDFGASVIKVEHPDGDPLRGNGPRKNGQGLLWKLLGRNKQAVTINLSKPEGQELLLRLAERADVLIENFRPGVMERWNLGYDRLSAANPGLVMVRVTGFGQFGPYSNRAGFGTLAEAMSGFAHITGQTDGPPTLPPFGLSDAVTAISAAYGAMIALYHRDNRGGRGQVIDLAIIEPIVTVLGAQPTIFDQLGIIQERFGNRTVNNSPRNTYRAEDGRWLAVSTSVTSVAERVMRTVGHPEVIDEPWFATGLDRASHGDELDEMVAAWVGRRSREEAIQILADAGAAVAPVYDVSELMDDPQYRALETIVSLPDEELGTVRMQNVLFRMLDTPGRVKFAGRRLGQDNEAVFGELGLGPDRLTELAQRGVI